MNLINSPKKYEMDCYSYYNSLSTTDRDLAWESFVTWTKNPFGDMTRDWKLIHMALLDLLTLECFCPISNENLIAKMLQPAAKRKNNECFVMVHPIQSLTPLLWVCALGGSSRIIRVHINIPTPSHRKYAVISIKDNLAFASSEIRVILSKLHAHYAPDRIHHETWTQLHKHKVVKKK